MKTYANRYVEDGTPAQQGGMGTVIVCTDPHLGRKVAIKFLQVGGDKRRIQDEIRALQQIRSKHVVQIYDIVIEQPGNVVGVVQEYIVGADLSGFLALKAGLAEYLRVLYQIACGVADIHAHQKIHRDIKPNNIKRDQENLLKIFDFGLSRSDDDAHTMRATGTPGYMAPEFYSSAPIVRFSKAADVYAVGATAVYLALGALPPEFIEMPPRADQWAARAGFAKLATPPAQVAHLLNRCLASDPLARPTMAELRDSIAAHLVHNQHRALLVYNQQTHVCDRTQPSVRLMKEGAGAMGIKYDGLAFAVSTVEGEARINNIRAVVGAQIPGGCVITLGTATGPRTFITMDVSNPEVVL